MATAHPTTDFLVTYSGNLVEVWIDWIPAVDGGPEEPVTGRLEGDVLVIEPTGDSAAERQGRRIEGIDAKIVEDLNKTKKMVLFLSGPSGVIGEHAIAL